MVRHLEKYIEIIYLLILFAKEISGLGIKSHNFLIKGSDLKVRSKLNTLKYIGIKWGLIYKLLDSEDERELLSILSLSLREIQISVL
jgi:hypothetical protein